MKNNSTIIIRLPKKIKDEFHQKCAEELIDMSVKIRQMIYKQLKNKSHE